MNASEGENKRGWQVKALTRMQSSIKAQRALVGIQKGTITF